MTREYIIVLRVLDDADRRWWEALGIPDPLRLNEVERDPQRYVTVLVEEEVQR